MRAAIFHGPEDIRIDRVADPEIEAPTDAIIRITRTAICGSDLWFYRGQQAYEPGSRTGHEPMGIVEEVGAAVRHVEVGDLVLAPLPSPTAPASSVMPGCTPRAAMEVSGRR